MKNARGDTGIGFKSLILYSKFLYLKILSFEVDIQ
jgi:hypothetical protein